LIEIDYINGIATDEIFGWGRYQNEIHRKLSSVKLNRIEYKSLRFPFVSRTIPYQIYVNRYGIYLLTIKKRVKEGNIKHITHPGFAYILNLFEFDKTIVTCYDLIPSVYGDHSSYWRRNIEGMRKADIIITLSDFAKNEIVKYSGCSEDRMVVIYEGIDHAFYKPALQKDNSILDKYGIPGGNKLIMYVGSEHPRKNVPVLLKAFQKLKSRFKDVKLVKVGKVGMGPRDKGHSTLRLIRELNLEKDVIFTGYVPEEDLPKLYNAVDIYVSPTLYEGGFALPVLEAMACGCPVITSNIPPLVETVHDGGLLIDPTDVDALAASMYEALTDNVLRQDMISKGMKRASIFSWDKAAKETLNVYEKLARQ
jgi:glycosyltransferase involved in cell wall biosynthesis